MNNIMVDLETLGTVPGCSILSIGAVYFGPDGLAEDDIYLVIRRDSCVAAGLHEDPDTLAWWGRQSVEARTVLDVASRDWDPTISTSGAQPLTGALAAFTEFCRKGVNVKVWGNGADFDNPILACAYKAVGLKLGWPPYNGRCYRTLKNMVNGPKLQRVGTHHNALDDARSQALHAVQLLRLLPNYDWK